MKNPFALFGSQWIAKTVTLGLVVAGAAAVAIANIPAPVDRTLPDLPAKDASSWTLPLDRYQLVDTHKEDYALALLNGKCLAADGFDWHVPWQGADAFSAPAAIGVTVDRPLSAQEAATRGYHGAPVDGFSTYLWKKFVTQEPLPKKQDAQFDTCLKEARRTQLSGRETDFSAQDAAGVAARVASEAAKKAEQDPTVLATQENWRACMVADAPANALAAHLPDSPTAMPGRTLANTWSTDVPESVVGDTEKAVALQDVVCQKSSGYRAALYRIEYRLQSTVSAADLATLKKATTDQRVYDAKLDRIIAANLPPKPAQ